MHPIDILANFVWNGLFFSALLISILLPVAIRGGYFKLHKRTNTNLQLTFFVSCFVAWIGLGIAAQSDSGLPRIIRWPLFGVFILWTGYMLVGFSELSVSVHGIAR